MVDPAPSEQAAVLAAMRVQRSQVATYLLDTNFHPRLTLLPEHLHRVPAATTDLSPVANARIAGYLIATKAYFGVGPVTQVEYRDASGQPVTVPAKLAELQNEYTFQASKLGP